MAPSREYLADLFSNLSNEKTQSICMDHVAENVDWFIIGNTSLSGQYHTKKDFMQATVNVLGNGVIDGPLELDVINIVGGGEGTDWCAVEMRAKPCKTVGGADYDMRYCWCVRWEGEIMVQVRAYLDTQLLNAAVSEGKKD